MKKYICMILAVVMIAATLAACGSNETKKVATDGSTKDGTCAIGYISLSSVKDTVKATSVNGVVPAN